MCSPRKGGIAFECLCGRDYVLPPQVTCLYLRARLRNDPNDTDQMLELDEVRHLHKQQ